MASSSGGLDLVAWAHGDGPMVFASRNHAPEINWSGANFAEVLSKFCLSNQASNDIAAQVEQVIAKF